MDDAADFQESRRVDLSSKMLYPSSRLVSGYAAGYDVSVDADGRECGVAERLNACRRIMGEFCGLRADASHAFIKAFQTSFGRSCLPSKHYGHEAKM